MTEITSHAARQLARLGISVYSVDVTTGDVRSAGLHVVRLVAPGLYSSVVFPRNMRAVTVREVRGRTVALCGCATERNFSSEVALSGTSATDPHTSLVGREGPMSREFEELPRRKATGRSPTPPAARRALQLAGIGDDEVVAHANRLSSPAVDAAVE